MPAPHSLVSLPPDVPAVAVVDQPALVAERDQFGQRFVVLGAGLAEGPVVVQ